MPLLNRNKPLNKHIPSSILILIILAVILLAGNVFSGIKYSTVQKALYEAQALLETQKTNEKILDFTKLFIEKVLKAETEVDFEMRLKLENAARNLEDEEILAQWSKFVESKTEADAQEEVKKLLEILVNKITPQ